MGFALWLQDGVAWAQGTHEYRPMGAAVIASTSAFRARDFSARRRSPRRYYDGFAGYFASLEDVNRHLRKLQSQPLAKNMKKPRGRILSTL
jgi:hypothetical protein